MPKINVYEAQQNVAPLQTAPVESSLYTSGGKAFSDVAKQVDDITQKFREIRNVRETTKASTDLQLELDQIETQAANDPNFEDVGAYQKKIDAAMGKHLSSITEPAVREKAQNDFRLKSYSSYSNVQSNFRKRQVEASQYALAKDIDTAKQAYVKTVDPTKKQLFMDGAMAAVQAHMKAGIITSETAVGLENAIKKDWASSEAMFDAETNPQMALDNLHAGNYKNLDDPAERRKVYAFANAMKNKQEKEIKKQQEEQQQKAVNEIYLDVLGGKATVDSISSRIGVDITAKDAEHYIEMLTKETQTSTDPIAYKGYLDSIYDAGTKQEVNAIVNRLASDGKIANAKRLELVKLASSMDVKDGDQAGFFTNLSNMYKNITSVFSGKKATDAHDLLVSKVKPEDTQADIMRKTKEAINETAIKNNPHLQNLSTTPKKVVDAYGNTGSVYLDDKGELQIEEDDTDGSIDDNTAE